MKYDLENHKLIEISTEWIKRLILFGKLKHPELLPQIGAYGRINALNYSKAINKLAELYFKEIFHAF